MTRHPSEGLVRSFPLGGYRIQVAYLELAKAASGSPVMRELLGDPALLPRPWDPSSCTDPDLRRQVWRWLDDVVTWLNHQYTWEPSDMIPTCWPHHPHLVHELAVLADQRRTATLAATSDPLESWHRYTLPGFLDRTQSRLRDLCDDGHQPWPGRSRHTRHTSPEQHQVRDSVFFADTETPPEDHASRRDEPRHTDRRRSSRLAVVDLKTGELDPPTGIA